MNEAKTEKKKNYYMEGIKILLKKEETFEDYKRLYANILKHIPKEKQLLIIFGMKQKYQKIKGIKNCHGSGFGWHFIAI